jgi:hypothetical protein
MFKVFILSTFNMETSWFIPFEYENIRPRWFRIIHNCLSYLELPYQNALNLSDRVGRELLQNRVPYQEEEKFTILYTIIMMSVSPEDGVDVHRYFQRYYNYHGSDAHLEWVHRIQTSL